MQAPPAESGPCPPRPLARFLALWAPPVLYTALIFALSSIPVVKAPLLWRAQDKVLHFVEFALLAALLFRALRAGLPGRLAALAAFVATAGTGALNEVWQSFVPNRTADFWDGVANAAGAAAGIALWALLARRRTGAAPEETDTGA